MRLATFFADCRLPEQAQHKQDGFDWRWAMGELTRTAGRYRLPVDVVTDERTELPGPWLRTGNAMDTGLMLWLLDAQAAAIEASRDPLLMVSPDTLIAGPLDWLFGRWDVCLLTRPRPKPIINSVIAVRPSPGVSALWAKVCRAARHLPESSRTWGADIDALVQVLNIRPMENGIRTVDGVSVRFMPVTGRFVSVSPGAKATKLRAPLWDFKGARKAHMPDYARLL